MVDGSINNFKSNMPALSTPTDTVPPLSPSYLSLIKETAASSSQNQIHKAKRFCIPCTMTPLSICPSFMVLLVLVPIMDTMAQSADPLGNFCNQDIPTTSPISSNVDRVLSELVGKAPSTGFAVTSYGTGQDKVYGLAQCRGDVSATDCGSCVQDARKQIRQLCPNVADARIWYDYCFLRYENSNFVGQLDTSYGIFYINVDNVTDPDKFNKALGKLMDQIEAEAVVPNNGGLGKGKTKLTPFLTLYGLVQCTRDLPELSCAQCLAVAVGNFPNVCADRKGCRVLYSSCYVRYELYPFFFPLDKNNTSPAANAKTMRKIVHP